jgi:hypothetical protein
MMSKYAKGQRIVIYHDDADGRCAAAIAGRAAMESGLFYAQYIAVDYGAAVPDLYAMGFDAGCGDEVWLVDFSFRPDDMRELVERAKGRVVWIDHHYTAIAALDEFKDLPGVRKDGVAASLLVWNFVYPDRESEIPWAVRFIADRDVWRFYYGDWSHFFYEAFIALEDTSPNARIWEKLFRDTAPCQWPELDFPSGCEFTLDMLERGQVLRSARISQLRYTARWLGRELNLEVQDGAGRSFGYRAMIINCHGSGDLGVVIQDMGFDVAWCYVQRKVGDRVLWKHSLYSRVLDVGAVCKAFGGGGHKGAAGFETETCIEVQDASGISVLLNHGMGEA